MAVNPQSGHVSAHPLIPVRAAARRDVRTLAKEFGLTPSSRADLGRPPSVPENDADDPFAAPPSLRHMTAAQHDVAAAANWLPPCMLTMSSASSESSIEAATTAG